MTTLELRNKLVFWAVAIGTGYTLYTVEGMSLVLSIGVAFVAGIAASIVIALLTDRFFD